MGDNSVSNIFNKLAKKKAKKELEVKDPDESSIQKEQEKERDLLMKIKLWKQTSEYGRLGSKARHMIEKAMREEAKKHSKTIMLLTKMMDKYETLWPTGESRVPFFVQDFEMRKYRN